MDRRADPSAKTLVLRKRARDDAPPESTLAVLTVTPRPEVCPVTAYLSTLSERSRERMLVALEDVASWLATGTGDHRQDPRTIPWSRVTFAHAAMLRSKLLDHANPRTANVIIAGFRGVLRALITLDKHTPQTLAALQIKHITATAEAPGRWIPAAEVQQMLAFWTRNPDRATHKRNRAILAVLYYTGARCTEIVSADLTDLRIAHTPTGNIHTLTLHGKGRKERTVPLAVGAQNALRDYLAERGTVPGPLFVQTDKANLLIPLRCNRIAVARVVATAWEGCNLPHTTAHDFRRTFISELLERGADLARVQALVGHADPQTTSKYDRRGLQLAQSVVEQLPSITPEQKR